MNVHEIMSIDIVTASPKAPFRDLWEHIFQNKIHSIPVVDEKKKLLGIIVEQDLVTPLYAEQKDVIEDFASAASYSDLEDKIKELRKMKAEHVMCQRVIFARKDTPVMRALSRMIIHKLRQLPVLDDDDTVIGVVSKSDIFKGLFNAENQQQAEKKTTPKKKSKK